MLGHEQVKSVPQEPPGEAIHQPIFHEGGRRGDGQKATAVLPAREGAPHLYLDEAEGRVTLTHEPAHGQRDSQAAEAVIEDGSRLPGLLAEHAYLQPRRAQLDRVAGIGEEREHNGTGTADHEAVLDDVIDHQM